MVKVSVCMATYNGARFIKEQISSILHQLKEDDELIISDDSSNDLTLSIIDSFEDKRIKLFSGQKFKNPIFNFENALSHATGEVIFLADQDDVWMDFKVETILKSLQHYDLVVSNAVIGDESLTVIRNSYFEWRNSRTGIAKNFIKNSYLGCCMAFRRKVLEIAMPFPQNIPMHDMWIGMIAEIYFKPVFIEDKLMIYRRHGGNATFLNEDYTSNESLFSQLSFRFNLLIAVTKRMAKKKFNL